MNHILPKIIFLVILVFILTLTGLLVEWHSAWGFGIQNFSDTRDNFESGGSLPWKSMLRFRSFFFR